MAVMAPMTVPPMMPGAAKNASPLPIVPSRPVPSAATTAPTAAYLAYRSSRRIAYRMTYLQGVSCDVLHYGCSADLVVLRKDRVASEEGAVAALDPRAR